MIKFPVIEFYITNVCNLECRGCNRFNNYNFKGHQYWNDYATEIEAWSTRIDPKQITILGGEPLLNPDLEKWASNLRRLWPKSNIMIQTNGTYQRPEHLEYWDKYEVGFGISLHDTRTAHEIRKKWEGVISDEAIMDGFVFRQASIIKTDDYFTLHKSDPKSAFVACGMSHDHTISEGKLYACPVMSVLPLFRKQFNLKLSSYQQELLDAYRPLEFNCSEEELQNFADTTIYLSLIHI